MVYKWCGRAPVEKEDTEQSGREKPVLDRIREIYGLTKDIWLVRWLCNEAGGFFVVNPERPETKTLDEAFFAETRDMVRAFSELLGTVTASFADDKQIDKGEAGDIRGKWEDLKACVGAVCWLGVRRGIIRL